MYGEVMVWSGCVSGEQLVQGIFLVDAGFAAAVAVVDIEADCVSILPDGPILPRSHKSSPVTEGRSDLLLSHSCKFRTF